MELDVSALLATYNELTESYSNLEEVEMNLFNKLSNIYGMDWQDANSIRFGKQIDTERNESDRFRMYTWNEIGLYKFIHSKYSELGKKVRCNLENQGTVLSALDRCIAEVDSINGAFSCIDMNFYYPEFYTLRNKMYSFLAIKNQLVSIRYYFVSLFSKVKSFENEIAAKITSLEDFMVNKFEFQFITSSTPGDGITLGYGNVQDTLFTSDCKNLELYSNEENNVLNRMNNSLNRLSSVYHSSNVGLMNGKIDIFHDNVSRLDINRKEYLSSLDEVLPLYGIVIDKTIKNFKEYDE